MTSYHRTSIFTDGSIFSSSAGLSYFIPKLIWSFSDKLSHCVSSFSAECYAVISALQYIFLICFHNLLIVSDSKYCLSIFRSHPTHSITLYSLFYYLLSFQFIGCTYLEKQLYFYGFPVMWASEVTSQRIGKFFQQNSM